jgi:hypothetical protein
MSKFTSHLDKALNFDGAAKLLADKGINALNEEFKRRGEQAKQKTEGDKPADKDAPEQKDWTPLLTEALHAVDEHEQKLDEADTAHKAYVEATSKKIQALEEANTKALKRLDDAEKALKAIKEDTPRRASEASETKLSEAEEKEAKDKIEKRTVQYDPAYPGMQVPLKQS